MLRLLLVDDEYLMRETLKIIFSKINNISVVGEAATGKKALELFDSTNPDLVFLDITIPGIDIFEFIKYIKSTHSQKKIILLTDYGSSDIVANAQKIGADGHLMKPSRPKDIIELVQKYAYTVSLEPEDLDQMIERFNYYVFHDDFKNTREQLKRISLHLLPLYETDLNSVRKVSEAIFVRLENTCHKKGLFLSKNIKWIERIKTIDMYNFESTISSIVEEIFEKIIDTKSINDKKVIQSVLNYIEKNYHKGVTLEEAAEHVHLSPFYLSKLFKKELKVNFVSYVMDRKIEKAKELLEYTDMPVINIALELNYKEANYFSKVFKKVTGMTPSDYRKAKEKEREINNTPIIKKNNIILNGKWYI